jgi:pimeloyl-ACP methyl ester carboxylesterase
MFFNDFGSFEITTQKEPHVEIHGFMSGNSSSTLPPLLLLHGFPQTRHMWHRVAAQLFDKFTVVIPDLRGYGDSSKPGDISDYAKSIMAKDFIVVMDTLGFSSFFVCAHDRGARVTHKLCVDYPQHVRKAILLDICPTLSMYEKTDLTFAKAYFHWFFLIQKEPLPETLISAAPRRFIEMIMGLPDEVQLQIIDSECFEFYAKAVEDPATVHSMCQDYRAGATLDMDEARRDLSDGKLVKCPLRIIWGSKSIIGSYDVLEEWRAVTHKGVVVDGYSVESGHSIPDEAPGDVVAAIVDFFESSS